MGMLSMVDFPLFFTREITSVTFVHLNPFMPSREVWTYPFNIKGCFIATAIFCEV